MGEQEEQRSDEVEISEETIIEKLIESRHEELHEKHTKKVKADVDGNYVKPWDAYLRDIKRGYKSKIDKLFKNIHFNKKYFRHDDGKYYYPEFVALVLEAYLSKEFSNKQMRSYFQKKNYELIKYTDRNGFFLEVYDMLIEKYEYTETAQVLKNERILIKKQYEEYEVFFNDINDRITAFGNRMNKLVKEIIPQETGITGISEEVFIPEIRWFMEQPTVDTIKEIAKIHDVDTNKGLIVEKKHERFYPPRSIISREDAKIMMDSLEEIFENAQNEWQGKFVSYFKEQRKMELNREFEKNDSYETIVSEEKENCEIADGEYRPCYFQIDKEAILTSEEMAQVALLKSCVDKRVYMDVPDDVGGLFYLWEIDRELLLSAMFRGLEITDKNDPKGIVDMLKNISDLNMEEVQFLLSTINEYNELEEDEKGKTDFGRAIELIFEHQSWSHNMNVQEFVDFFKWTLYSGYLL